METRTVKLAFSAPVHFGNGRLSDGGYTCTAGTLFSALYIEAMRIGIADDLLTAAKSGAFAISDAFPYIEDRFYLPKPMVQLKLHDCDEKSSSGGEDSRARKASKKLDYIPAEQYADYLAGEFDPIGELERFKVGESSLRTKVNLTRVHKDDAEPYHVGSFSFKPGAGLYFLLQGSFDIDPILEQLRYSGLGGERSSGYGRFEYSVSPRSPLEQISATESDGSLSVLLSTAAPKAFELTDSLLEGSRYRVVRKGGFVQSATHSSTPQKKRDLYLFAAGSVFSNRFEGDVFDVNATPSAHPVYRYARAMWAEV